MELIPIECVSCHAKLKIKAMPARMPTEVKCPKCGKPIPVAKSAPAAATPATAAPAKAPTAQVVAPVVSKPIAPVAPVVPVAPIVTPQAKPVPVPVMPPVIEASSTAQLTPPPKNNQQPSSAQPAKKAAAPIVLGQVPDASSGANITVVCPTCQWQSKVSQTLIGKKIRCKQCSGIIPVTSPEPSAVTAEPVVAPAAVATPAPVVTAEPPAPSPVTPPPAPHVPVSEPVKIVPEISHPPRQEPVVPQTPVARWTPPEVTINEPLASARSTAGTTVLVGEIATLKSKLEAAARESARSVTRFDEADKKALSSEMRAREAEQTLHDLAGKSAIDAMNANRKIADLEAQLAPLEAKITTLNQALALLTNEFNSELEGAEKRVTHLKQIMASRNSFRTS